MTEQIFKCCKWTNMGNIERAHFAITELKTIAKGSLMFIINEVKSLLNYILFYVLTDFGKYQ